MTVTKLDIFLNINNLKTRHSRVDGNPVKVAKSIIVQVLRRAMHGRCLDSRLRGNDGNFAIKSVV